MSVKAAGAPNITGTLLSVRLPGNTYTGAFAFQKFFDTHNPNNGQESAPLIDFDASRSNAIYGKADTVQPPAICSIPQFKI